MFVMARIYRAGGQGLSRSAGQALRRSPGPHRVLSRVAMRGALLALPFVAVLLAGCGGGNAGGPGSVAGCLREHGATVKEAKVTPTFLTTGIEHAQVVTFKGQR